MGALKATKDGCVLALSGGLDSTTLATWAVDRWGDENVHAIAFDYGQKHKSELLKARAVADELDLATFQVITLPDIFKGGGSSLMDEDVPVASVTYAEVSKTMGSQPTVVPYRNAHFISMAATIALIKDVGHILVGVHAGDAGNFHYPDCTPEYIGAQSNAVLIGTDMQVRLLAPFQWMSKGEIVQKAAELRAPLHLTQSCYNGKDPACGVCATCQERLDAFHFAHMIDPIPYELPMTWPSLFIKFPY